MQYTFETRDAPEQSDWIPNRLGGIQSGWVPNGLVPSSPVLTGTGASLFETGTERYSEANLYELDTFSPSRRYAQILPPLTIKALFFL